jgi:hypothetical protein
MVTLGRALSRSAGARDNVLQSVTVGKVAGKSQGIHAGRRPQPRLHRPEEHHYGERFPAGMAACH